jgi:glycosyltransferase involved in cell wall biosynthesis
MDIFCLPSLQQGIGTIMLQAMALGRPVIATRVGGVHRVIRDNENGLLVPPASSEALSDRILELLNDPHRARLIGCSARDEVIREFNVERMVQQTADLYREILEPSDTSVAAPVAAFAR